MTPRQQSSLRRDFEDWWEGIGRRIVPETVPKQDLFDIVERVSQHVPIAVRPQQRERLKQIWKAANEFVASATGLDPDVARQYGIGTDLVDTLARIRDDIDPISPLRPKRSGAKKDSRTNASRKKMSARSVCDLLTRLDIETNPEADGLYRKISEGVFQLATRGNDPGNMYQVCLKAKEQLGRDA